MYVVILQMITVPRRVQTLLRILKFLVFVKGGNDMSEAITCWSLLPEEIVETQSIKRFKKD